MDLFRKKFKDKIKKFEQEIKKVKTFEEKRSEFLHIASHQLKSPLTNIRFILSMLSVDKELSEEKRKKANSALSQSEIALEFLDDVFRILKLENGDNSVNFEEIDIESFLKEITLEKQMLAREKNIHISKNISSIIPIIKSDPFYLKVIIINILENAIKYSLRNSKILIEIYESANKVNLSIKDYGIGIAKADIPRIFEKFFRTQGADKMAPHGTGLGLYLVKIACQKLKIKIDFESQLNKGTTFFLEIPMK